VHLSLVLRLYLVHAQDGFLFSLLQGYPLRISEVFLWRQFLGRLDLLLDLHLHLIAQFLRLFLLVMGLNAFVYGIFWLKRKETSLTDPQILAILLLRLFKICVY
jgi:hypothetical protein